MNRYNESIVDSGVTTTTQKGWIGEFATTLAGIAVGAGGVILLLSTIFDKAGSLLSALLVVLLFSALVGGVILAFGAHQLWVKGHPPQETPGLAERQMLMALMAQLAQMQNGRVLPAIPPPPEPEGETPLLPAGTNWGARAKSRDFALQLRRGIVHVPREALEWVVFESGPNDTRKTSWRWGNDSYTAIREWLFESRYMAKSGDWLNRIAAQVRVREWATRPTG